MSFDDDNGDQQGSVERKKTEGVGTSQGIQGRGLSQEKGDDDSLPDESSVKKKNKSKKKSVGDQGVSGGVGCVGPGGNRSPHVARGSSRAGPLRLQYPEVPGLVETFKEWYK